MAFGWDVDDDIYDEDEDELDEEHPFGEDEDPNADDGTPDAGQKDEEDDVEDQDDDKKEEGKKGKGEKGQDDVKDLDKEDDKKQKQKKKKESWDPEVTRANAKQNEMPEFLYPYACPICKKKTLYSDKVMPTGIRLTLYIIGSIYGAVPTDKAITALHLRCMNEKCKSYWKKTGDYFTINPTNPTVPEKHRFIFHINR